MYTYIHIHIDICMLGALGLSKEAETASSAPADDSATAGGGDSALPSEALCILTTILKQMALSVYIYTHIYIIDTYIVLLLLLSYLLLSFDLFWGGGGGVLPMRALLFWEGLY